jgi:hypothetical protein
MMGNVRFTVWVRRGSGSIFGNSPRPVNRDGIILTINDERHAQAECAHKFDLPTSSWWILGFTALVTVLAVVMALARVLGALAT